MRAAPSMPIPSRPPTVSAICTGRTTAMRSVWTPTSRCSSSTTLAPHWSGTQAVVQAGSGVGRAAGRGAVCEENGKFHLFYSANAFDSYSYAVGHAVADSPLGPFTKSQEPVVVSNDVAAGPGHCALNRKGGKVWNLYHAWPPDAVGSELPGRNPWLSEVLFTPDGSVTVVPPTVDYPTRP